MYFMGNGHTGSQSPLRLLAEAPRSCFSFLSRCWGNDPQSVEITTTWGLDRHGSSLVFLFPYQGSSCDALSSSSTIGHGVALWPAVSPYRHGTNDCFSPEISPFNDINVAFFLFSWHTRPRVHFSSSRLPSDLPSYFLFFFFLLFKIF
jgi:hypothetical protein